MTRGIGLALIAAALGGCGGSGTTTVGGTVLGLQPGTAVTLQINGKETLVVGANGAFEFRDTLNAEQNYDVRIVGQPARAFCAVTHGSGTVDRNASRVTNVDVQCVPAFAVGGLISGLASGGSVTLTDGTDTTTFSGTGTFTFSFPTSLPSGTSFTVSVTAVEPAGRTCTVANPSGTVQSSDVANILVTCS